MSDPAESPERSSRLRGGIGVRDEMDGAITIATETEEEFLSQSVPSHPHPYLALRSFARGVAPSRWDVAAFILLFGIFAIIATGAHEMTAPLLTLQTKPVSLSLWALPNYALRTTLRMLAAMVLSLLFSIGYATLAARSRRAERVLIPILDILQSVPVLGFLSFTVTFFLGLFPHSVLGPELASIFAIFTSQAWNMTFSVYQSLRTLPPDLVEASRSFRCSPMQRFMRLEMPFAMPGLIWNMMMSMSGGWFFVVASEAISVGNKTFTLPGIGSYVAEAIGARDLGAIAWAILAMLVVILAYDQLMFRPLIAWGERFRFDETGPRESLPESWFLRLMQRSQLFAPFTYPFRLLANPRRARRPSPAPWTAGALGGLPRVPERTLDVVWYGAVFLLTAYGAWTLIFYLHGRLEWIDVGTALLAASKTLLRVLVLVALASLIWVPIGVMVGLRPRLASIAQPIAQFMAAFPANLFFPIAVALIVHFNANPDIWLSPLMILGTQWYILFNVVAGASVFPDDLLLAARNFRIGGLTWWRKVMIPGILPYYVTGAMTAAGGSWNASIVAEFVQWGDTKLHASGLGDYIAVATAAGDYPRIVLGVAIMSLFVVTVNRTIWRPMYGYAERMNGTVQ